MKASEFDEAFDRGDDMTEYLDYAAAERINLAVKRVNVDFPEWMVKRLDLQARRLGVSRQSVIKQIVAAAIER
jgi:hypothetical protein